MKWSSLWAPVEQDRFCVTLARQQVLYHAVLLPRLVQVFLKAASQTTSGTYNSC